MLWYLSFFFPFRPAESIQRGMTLTSHTNRLKLFIPVTQDNASKLNTHIISSSSLVVVLSSTGYPGWILHISCSLELLVAIPRRSGANAVDAI
jgi:hypothetical protein